MAEPVLYNKQKLASGHVLEIKIYELFDNKDYPDGFKYSLIMINPKSGERVLMDNHKPKSHHYHLNDKEYLYRFKSIDVLFEDFQKLAKDHLGVTL